MLSLKVPEQRAVRAGTSSRKQKTAEEEARLIQVFSQWTNFLLERRGLAIETVAHDISDGLILIQLAEILTTVPVAKHNETPTLLLHNIENVTIALDHFSVYGNLDAAKVVNPAAIAQNDVKQILTLFWLLTFRFKMKDLKKRWQELKTNGSKHEEFLQLKQEIKKIEEDEDFPTGIKIKHDEENKNAVKVKAQAQYVAAAENLKQWADYTMAELEAANRLIDSDFASGPDSLTPSAIAKADWLKRMRDEFREKERLINDNKSKKKTQTEDLYIDMKKAGCSDPASCPFSLVEEYINKLEGVVFERRRKLDDRLRRAEAEAEVERDQIRFREAEAELELRRRAQLESEREKLEEEKRLMEAELRERANLLKQELLKLKGGSTITRGEGSSSVPPTKQESDYDDTRVQTRPDPRKILNSECTSGSLGSFLLRRATRTEEEGAPCSSCKRPLGHTQMLLVDGKQLFHASCFVCRRCGKEFEDYYYEHKGEIPLCFEHYAEASELICNGCGQLIRSTTVTLAMGKKWHSSCFSCFSCHKTLKRGHYVHEGEPYCRHDFYRLKGLLCVRCEKPVGAGDKSFEGRAWHKTCWACTTCNRPFGKDGFYGFNGLPYCRAHFEEMELRLPPRVQKNVAAMSKFASYSNRADLRRMPLTGILTNAAGLPVPGSAAPVPSGVLRSSAPHPSSANPVSASSGPPALARSVSTYSSFPLQPTDSPVAPLLASSSRSLDTDDFDRRREWDRDGDRDERSRRRREQMAREKEEALLRELDRRKRELDREKEDSYLKELERKKREIERDLERERLRAAERDRDRPRDRDRESTRDRDRDRDRDRESRERKTNSSSSSYRDRDRDRPTRARESESARDRERERLAKESREKEGKDRRASVSYPSVRRPLN